jgi:hypothetical protein
VYYYVYIMRQNTYAREAENSADSSQDGPAATEFSIPTVGEYAEAALSSFSELQEPDCWTGQASLDPRLGLASLKLVHACLSLMDKFPRGTRQDFASTLPFTALELQLLRQPHVEDEPVTNEIACRVHEWVHRSPILVDEVNVHVTQFLH